MSASWDILLIPIGLLLVVLAYITLNRYIAYKERVELARLGYSPEDSHRQASRTRRGGRGVLWGGVITLMSGLALLLGLSTLGRGVWLLGGLLPLFVGLGMVLIYFIILDTPLPQEPRDDKSEDQAEQSGSNEQGHDDGRNGLVGDERGWLSDLTRTDQPRHRAN